jgi:hypothetical protein
LTGAQLATTFEEVENEETVQLPLDSDVSV